LEYDYTTRVRTTYDVATRVGTSHLSTTRVGILMTRDLRLIETACIHCLYKPVVGTELGKSSSVAFNSQTTLPKLVFTDCWDLANPNTPQVRRAWTHIFSSDVIHPDYHGSRCDSADAVASRPGLRLAEYALAECEAFVQQHLTVSKNFRPAVIHRLDSAGAQNLDWTPSVIHPSGP
jgi:hypothetical protein